MLGGSQFDPKLNYRTTAGGRKFDVESDAPVLKETSAP